MIGAVRLGLRLAGVGATRGAGGAAWLRSGMVALAGCVGTVLLLALAAIVSAEQLRRPEVFSDPDLRNLMLSVIAAVAVPILVLAATVGRLSAALRDRRLANLRLLGLTPSQTRLVAAVEAGVAATVGSLVGLLVFLAAHPLLADVHVAGRHWAPGSLSPTWWEYLVGLLLVPFVVAGVSALPARLGPVSTLTTVRRADARRPGWWRVVPLLLGAAMSTYVIVVSSHENADSLFGFVIAGAVLLALGIVLTVPVFVRLVADLLVRCSRPTLVIAGRRLQAQPAGMSRVVAGLLIGLFVVTGARGVVVAFEDTSEYRAQAARQSLGESVTLRPEASRVAGLEAAIAGADGIRETLVTSELHAKCGDGGGCAWAIVASCAQLAKVAPDLTGCRDDRPAWLPGIAELAAPSMAGPEMDWYTSSHRRTPGLSLSSPERTLTSRYPLTDMLGVAVFLPRSLPGVAALAAQSRPELVVVAEPGVDITRALAPAGVHNLPPSDHSYLTFVSRLRAIVWAVAAVILAVGLLTYAIAALDRAVARRRELVAIQLLGVGPAMLRRTQWVEAALPLGIGSALGVGLGLLAGGAYLGFGGIAYKAPWTPALVLAVIAMGCSVVAAGLTVLAASPRIRPDLIRTE